MVQQHYDLWYRYPAISPSFLQAALQPTGNAGRRSAWRPGWRSVQVRSGRLTREDWITSARKALISSGIDDVKVDVLARRLKVTRGSFYWHFKDRQELLDALLTDWATNNRKEIAAIEKRVEDGATGLVELFMVWLGEDPDYPSFDIAIRVWARKSKLVARFVREVDDSWIGLFHRFLQRSGMADPEALVRARIIYYHQIGYYALSISETVTDRIKLAPYYFLALTGSSAPGDMEEVLAVLERPQKTPGRPRRRSADKAE